MAEATIQIPGTKKKVPRWALIAGAGGVLAVFLLKGKRSDGSQEQGQFNQEGQEGSGGLIGLFEELIDLYPDPVFEPDPESPSPAPGPEPSDPGPTDFSDDFAPTYQSIDVPPISEPTFTPKVFDFSPTNIARFDLDVQQALYGEQFKFTPTGGVLRIPGEAWVPGTPSAFDAVPTRDTIQKATTAPAPTSPIKMGGGQVAVL